MRQGSGRRGNQRCEGQLCPQPQENVQEELGPGMAEPLGTDLTEMGPLGPWVVKTRLPPSTGLCGCSGPSSQVLTPWSTHVYRVTRWMGCGPSHPTDPEAGAVTPENERKGPHTRHRIHRAQVLTRPSPTRACSHTLTYTHVPTLTRAHLHTCTLTEQHTHTPVLYTGSHAGSLTHMLANTTAHGHTCSHA